MLRLLVPLAFFISALPLAAAPAELSLQHRTLVRCSAAFALVASGQENGDAEAQTFPPLEKRGRDFFIRANARVMEEAGLDRAGIEQALRAEASAIIVERSIGTVMQSCLPLLPRK